MLSEPNPNAASSPSSSLEPEKHPIRTAPHEPPEGWAPLQSQTTEQHRLHAEFAPARLKICAALWGDGGSDLRRRAWRLDACCAFPVVIAKGTGEGAVSLGACRDRVCPRCALQRGREVAAKLAERVRGWNTCRFVTLTLKGTQDGLADTLSSLAAAFRRLRKDPIWTEAVRGGVYSIEITRGAAGDHWHAHLHVLTDGLYLDQGRLSDAWERASRGSRVVDIRAVHDRGAYAHYIAAYIAKPTGLSGWAPEHIAEFARATHGRRMIHGFGVHHRPEVNPPLPTAEQFLSAEHENEDEKPCREIATFAWVKKRASCSCPWALAALAILAEDLRSVRIMLAPDHNLRAAVAEASSLLATRPPLSELLRMSRAEEELAARPPRTEKRRRYNHPTLAPDWTNPGPTGTGPR
jgi:hypothetical protein